VRVAYLTGIYPRATDTFIQREVAALREAGVEVHTFAVRRPGDDQLVGADQERERAGTTYLLAHGPARMAAAHLRLALSGPGRYRRALALAWRTRRPGLKGTLWQLAYFAEAGLLARLVRRRGVDHLHNHLADASCTVAMLAAELGGFPFSFTIHGPGVFFEAVTWRLDEKARRAAFVACISWFARSQVAVFAPADRLDHLHVVHCGVDLDRAVVAEHRDGGQRVLFVGRLVELKGLAGLIEALARLADRHPDTVLTVVGDGPDRSRFEALARRRGVADRVRFVGYRPADEVAELLGRVDVFALPSYAEGVPVSLMEAMAAGVPVVATQVGGVSELVEDGVSGHVLRPGDTDQLTDALDRLLSDPGWRARLGAAGRRRVVADFDSRTEARRLLTLFRSVPAGTTPPIRPEPTPVSGCRRTG
jgi:glycosyltransferase involved in cell wall biosynthesis